MNKMNENYSIQERRILIKIVRDTISEYLLTGSRYKFSTNDKKLNEKRGVFVTLHKKGDLRGCIGYPLPVKSLKDAIIDNAISAAFEDPRFPPLGKDEFKNIDIEISVLTVPKKVSSEKDVQVGRDGIIISSGFHRGLLLPQVPVEQKWGLQEYISYGCMKAGLPADEWRRGVDIETFQAEVFGENNINV